MPIATSAEGCASGDCLPEEKSTAATGATSPHPGPLPQGRERGSPASSAPFALTPSEPEGPPEPPELDDSDAPPSFDDGPPRPAAAPARVGTSTDDDKWRRAVEALREASPRHGKSLSYARFLGFTPEGVKLVFPQDAAFHRSQIIGMSRAMVEQELARSLGRPIKLTEDTSAAALQSAPKSIAEIEQSDRSTREKSIEQKVRSSSALKNVIRHLGGALEHIAYL
ncbi:MAG: hypothetical protein JNM17_19800, partial [Archangium sp.]|nr:hypothetical protein [Archangium sp.]